MRNRSLENAGAKKGKNLFLSFLFCICALAALCAVLAPVGGALAAAAPSPHELFGEAPDNEGHETVPLAEHGGYPTQGENYGRLTISGTAVDCNLYYGDSERELSAGAGTYTGGKIPGEGGTVLIAGHTGTYFRDFESAQLGADIAIETRYGTYHYTISDMRVVEETDASAYDLAADEENIILYTCYPFGQLSTTPYRYFIYGTPVSGPQIEQEAAE